MTFEKKESFYDQRIRLKEYLEEMFVRQVSIPNHECDDLIAYYCKISNEKITILSSDKDLTQLINERVHIYSPISKEWITDKHKVKLGGIMVPVSNVKVVKIILGDKSDNIDGILNFGEKRLIKYFPEVLETTITADYILEKSKEILLQDEKNKPIKNLVCGTTKSGTYGDEYFRIREKIVSLSNPLMTEDAKKEVELYYTENIDPDGRGYKNLMKMMIDDGIFKYLPKHDNAWVEFLQPILKLTRKEKKRFKN
jgi:5'-3' exonuclease